MPRRAQQETPPKPLTLGVIGIGQTSSEITEALLTDLTSPYENVTLLVAPGDAFWSSTTDDIMEWSEQNDIPYVAITDGGAPGKDFVPVLEDANETVKAARVAVKMVQLLEQAEGDGVLLVLGNTQDPEDPEAEVAVNKALELGVKAVDLLNGLEEFEFDEEPGDEGESTDGESPNATQVGDEYDDWGIRKLRAALREHPNKKLTDRAIGQLEKDDAIRALRVADQDALKGTAPEEVEQETEEAPKAETTRRARRAFAEGAAEGTGDEAQTLPRSRGADVLENQDTELATEVESVVEEDVTEGAANPNAGLFEDSNLRLTALSLAVQTGVEADKAIPLAQRFELYLKGERKAPGRPRADGSPAQLREINPETGKPVRRRPRRGSTD